MSKIIAIDEKEKVAIYLDGEKIELLADLTLICKAMLEEKITKEEIQYALDLAIEENKKCKKSAEEELDKEIMKIIETIMKK